MIVIAISSGPMVSSNAEIGRVHAAKSTTSAIKGNNILFMKWISSVIKFLPTDIKRIFKIPNPQYGLIFPVRVRIQMYTVCEWGTF